ncbi:class I adenylate-forming enzyme family protein [Panacagrimonas sp.]|uniref:class I adenylate-forming enzyme family protein n=1 Tax=Panacagrimonas sp. TaxID=2480088 RepID=UPI003B518343
MNLAQLLVRAARLFPDRPALFHGEELLCDYRELGHRAACIGGFLSREHGLQPGDRVALFMTNVPEYLELMYGAWYAGLVVVPINAKLHPREAQYIIENSGASALFVTHDLATGLNPLLSELATVRVAIEPGSDAFGAMYDATPVEAVERAAADVAWLFYTSGTTGRPKGVMLTQRNLFTMLSCHFMNVTATAPEDCAVYAAPMSHASGMANFPHMLVGGRHVVARSASFDPAEIVRLAAFHGNVFTFAAPTMVKRLAEHVEASGADPSGFKAVLYGGGPMYLEDIRYALRVMGDRFVQIYGQGETPMTITALSSSLLADREHPRYLERIASVGVAQALVEVKVTDEDGNELPVGEVGEIIVRGDTVMKGYWNDPEATARTIRNGWLFTGDMGCFDADGFLTLKDRSKDMIISGGSNIYPREIEEVLLQHPGVHEVSVVGRKHPEWGEEVVAFVAPKPGVAVTAAELDALCLDHIARFKRPKHYRMLEALPKSNYGKILKTQLRELLSSEDAAA